MMLKRIALSIKIMFKTAKWFSALKIIFMLISALSAPFLVYVTEKMITSITNIGQTSFSLYITAGWVAIFALINLWGILQGHISHLIQLKTVIRLKENLLPIIAEKVCRIQYRHFEDPEAKDIFHRLGDSPQDIVLSIFDTINDAYETEKNEHLKHEIKRLNETAREKAIWSDRVEATKIGTHQADRGRIGHLAAKMMKRSKAIQKRKETEIDEKSKLLKNIESAELLKISPLEYHSNRILSLNDVSISYKDTLVVDHVTFELNQKDRISIEGKNGAGKTSIIKLIMGENITYTGDVIIPDNLIFSYIPQDMSCLTGSLSRFIENQKINETLFKTILRKLDFSRDQFDKEISSYSDGQKKKVLIASSLSKSANVYLWDEPLNFVDVISRVQIEELIIHYMPTLIFVEHDSAFCNKAATKHIDLSKTK